MIKALLLDLDCTLLDEDKATVVATKAFYEVGEISFVGQQRERAREALGLKLSDAEADEAFAHHLRAYEKGWCCYDDVAKFTQRTKVLLKIAMTNAHRNQQCLKMERTGLMADVPDLVTP